MALTIVIRKGLLTRVIYRPVWRCAFSDVADETGKKTNLKKAKSPIGKLDEPKENYVHPYAEKEPLPAWPNGVNTNTGEVGGPRGPEPTRYGDWERKGRVTDF